MDDQNDNKTTVDVEVKTPTKPYGYNWDALKIEFLEGPWRTVSEFRRAKGMPEHKKSTYLTMKMGGWGEEKKGILAKAAEKATDDIIEERADDLIRVKERQARLARWLQLKGAEALKGMDPTDVDEARKLIVSGMQEERNALGVGLTRGGATTLTQVNVNLPKTKFDEILDGADYSELLRLVAEIRKERARRLGTGDSSQGQAKAQ